MDSLLTSVAPVELKGQDGRRDASGGLIDKTLQHLKEYPGPVQPVQVDPDYQRSALVERGLGIKLDKAI